MPASRLRARSVPSVRSPAALAAALAFLGALAALAPGCDGAGAGDPAGDRVQTARPAAAETGPAAREASTTPRRRGRPLPAFEGTTVEGRRVAASDLLGGRLVIFFFDPDEEAAGPAAEALQAIAPLRQDHNFRILGVATGAAGSVARKFVARHGLDFPVIDDASGRVSRRFPPLGAAAYLLVDADGLVTGARGAALDAEDAAALLEDFLREELRLPAARPALLEPVLGTYPEAPSFEGVLLDGEPFDSTSLAGRPAVLIFFLHTCPHCHRALEALKEQLAAIPAEQRPRLVGISVGGSAAAVRGSLAELDLDFFPVLRDPDRTLQRRFAATGGVPQILLLDAESRIRARSHGWREGRDAALLRMRLARLAGRPVPMLLHRTGYSGSELCGVCHTAEHATWRFTRHARAFDTLVRHGVDADPECVSCHVVGFGEPGGYALDPPTPHLEDVGCESCHGRGGPHLSPDFAPGHDYREACLACHDQKHSLGFSYERFLPSVSHAANAHLLDLPLAEKRAKLEALGEAREALFPNADADYVGSAACASCHAAEHATWSGQPHARAVETLRAEGRAGDAECLRCHTTGYGEGGFPKGGEPAAHAGLAAVGCESCHGPGGSHVASDAPKRGTITALADKCESCVILQICGRCHDQENDPGFPYEVQEKIEAQRHGTAAAGADEARLRRDPGPGTPESPAPGMERLAVLERAFAAGEPAP